MKFSAENLLAGNLISSSLVMTGLYSNGTLASSTEYNENVCDVVKPFPQVRIITPSPIDIKPQIKFREFSFSRIQRLNSVSGLRNSCGRKYNLHNVKRNPDRLERKYRR